MEQDDYDYNSHPYDMIAKLEWDSLFLRRQERRLLVLHKALHGHLSIPATKILRPTTRPSRSSNDRTFQQIRTRRLFWILIFSENNTGLE